MKTLTDKQSHEKLYSHVLYHYCYEVFLFCLIIISLSLNIFFKGTFSFYPLLHSVRDQQHYNSYISIHTRNINSSNNMFADKYANAMVGHRSPGSEAQI